MERANSVLVYYSIHYVCVFGGKKYKNEGTGQRSQQRFVLFEWWYIIKLISRTIKQGCQAGIKVTLSDNAQSLVVTEVVEDHNHEVDKVNELHT